MGFACVHGPVKTVTKRKIAHSLPNEKTVGAAAQLDETMLLV